MMAEYYYYICMTKVVSLLRKNYLWMNYYYRINKTLTEYLRYILQFRLVSIIINLN